MRIKVMILGFLSIVLLSACSGESAIDKMYVHMEEAVALESDFVAQQEPLTKLEEEEQVIYQEISALGMEEFEQITSLADEALQSIEKRREILETEKESIENAKEEFDQIESLVGELEDEALKEDAEALITIMEERYQAYLTLHDAYSTSLDNDEQLYQMLKDEEVEEKVISEQIDKVNEQYDQVIAANETFNEKTEAFNDAKRAFYESAELNVTYE